MIEVVRNVPRRGGAVFAALFWLLGPVAVPAAPPRVLSSLERLAPDHLKAAHDDVLRIKKSRHDLPPLPGLHDYRAILHAHAEDSSHTGGTRPEMLAEAKRAGVDAILLTDHYRPPRDFIKESWRGPHDGVLFLPGSEIRGFLIYPTRSIMDRMEEPTPAFVATVAGNDGLIFLSHIEERVDHAMTGLSGMEIYNRHFDAIKDTAGLMALVFRLTEPATLHELEESVRLYPDELFAFQVGYQAEYMAKWDRETAARRLTGVAANDCHHNMVLLVKVVDDSTVLVGTNVDRDDEMRTVKATLRPGIRKITKGHKKGDVVARLDLDPYHRSFRDASTHILATMLDEPTIRAALRAGHAYVSHDWMCDPTGFRFQIESGHGLASLMGDELKYAPGLTLTARFPVACRVRLMSGGKVVNETTSDRFEHPVKSAGVYRLEGWLDVGSESRPWVYSNPIYVR